MTIKRLILIVLTAFVILKLTLSLIESWGHPQIQSRLELYQTNLLLEAAEWQGGDGREDFKTALQAVVGEQPLKTALEQYQEARDGTKTNLEKAREQLQQLKSATLTPLETAKPRVALPPVTESSLPSEQLLASIKKLEKLIDELDLRLGILQVEQGERNAALKTWTNLISRSDASGVKTADVLVGLWSKPPRLQPDTFSQIQKNLDGWFRYRALAKFYKSQQRQEDLLQLQAHAQAVASQAVVKLAIVTSIPLLGCLIGLGLVISLVVQLLVQGKRSLLAQNADVGWSTPWDAETVWQVFILGFFFTGQFLVPLLIALSGIHAASSDIRGQSFYVLVTYLLMASGTLIVLYLSIKQFFPLPEGWFRVDWRGGWILWGFGGYFVAVPLVILVALINQKLWQGQGGSNPILPIALENRDGVALLIFFVTASVAAPMFEEFIFRGFLLPSFTRYMPVWGAIVASSFLFAIAHLNLSEVLPLWTLGMLLGVVYTRSRNLLSSMLLHSLWNSGTLLSLFILGSGSM